MCNNESSGDYQVAFTNGKMPSLYSCGFSDVIYWLISFNDQADVFLKLRCDNMPNFKNDSQQFEYTFLLMLWSWLKSLVTLEKFINVYIYFENSHAKIISM